MDGNALGASAVHALVFAGGERVPASVAPMLPTGGLVIAADSGLAQARALGRPVDLVIGDLDSVDQADLDAAIAAGTAVETHPTDKDATDLELALDAAVARGARRVTLVGGHGGRLDHLLANALLLASPRYAAVDLDAWMGRAHVYVVRGRIELTGRVGSLCSVLAVGGEARGVSTTGLRFALTDDVLLPGSSRGVSNELVEPVASVTLGSGTVLAVQPDALEDLP
jgi:thiamine pyrophosphokinase